MQSYANAGHGIATSQDCDGESECVFVGVVVWCVKKGWGCLKEKVEGVEGRNLNFIIFTRQANASKEKVDS